MNKFLIADLVFTPNLAQITADIRNDQIEWSISIEAELNVIRGAPWQPRAYSEQLFSLDRPFLENWQDVLSSSVEWGECHDPIKGRVNALLYVFEHNDIYNSRIEFIPGHGRNVFVKWHALCDVFFGGYGSGLCLCIETAAIFKGIEVGTTGEMIDEFEANRRLRRFISKGDYEYLPPIDDCDPPIMMPKTSTRGTQPR